MSPIFDGSDSTVIASLWNTLNQELESLIRREATIYPHGVRWLVGCKGDVAVDAFLSLRLSTGNSWLLVAMIRHTDHSGRLFPAKQEVAQSSSHNYS